MTTAVRVTRHGGPEVLEVADLDPGEPGPGEVRLRQTAVGLNYIDVYHRSGLYPGPEPPFVLGVEAAGVVERAGAGVAELRPGDRVAYAGGPLGAYAAERVFPAERLVPVPDGVDDETAAAVLLKGLTVHYLLRSTYPLRGGETILVHAAAGGVGLLLCQWAAALGATVIGTVGDDAKAELARAHGCHHPVVYRDRDWAAEVRERTGGVGVAVVYDAVGAATFEGSLAVLARRGMLVSFGNASGPPPPLDVLELSRRGSLFLTRPSLFDYVADRDELLERARDLFGLVAEGRLAPYVGARRPLVEAADAHRDLEARATRGSTLLVP